MEKAYPNRIKAIDMLRMFKDRESAPVLKAIVSDGAKAFVAGLAKANAFGGGEPICRFQALSYAMMALREMRIPVPTVDLPEMRYWGDGTDLSLKLKKLMGDAV